MAKSWKSLSYLHEDIEGHTGHILQAPSPASKIPTTLLLWKSLVWGHSIVALLTIEHNLLSWRHTVECTKFRKVVMNGQITLRSMFASEACNGRQPDRHVPRFCSAIMASWRHYGARGCPKVAIGWPQAGGRYLVHDRCGGYRHC